jgi:hypothetical protein
MHPIADIQIPVAPSHLNLHVMGTLPYSRLSKVGICTLRRHINRDLIHVDITATGYLHIYEDPLSRTEWLDHDRSGVRNNAMKHTCDG